MAAQRGFNVDGDGDWVEFVYFIAEIENDPHVETLHGRVCLTSSFHTYMAIMPPPPKPTRVQADLHMALAVANARWCSSHNASSESFRLHVISLFRFLLNGCSI